VYFPASAALALTPIEDFFLAIGLPFDIPVSPNNENALPREIISYRTAKRKGEEN
jgi:hypothetical protein